MTTITRFAPSPTGYFHSGSYRTALFSWILARQNKGKFILRIEDTDKERSKKEYEENIIDSLKWMGLDYEEFYRQSDRTEIYKKYINKLIETGHAYVSKENPEAEGGRAEVIRFKNPNKKVSFDDAIRGTIEFDTTELGDFVIAKSFEEPVFHLVVVIDDHEMGITDIIRGEDHISNTPRQILIYEAIGASHPRYAHLPIVLGTDRSKLSKRKGAIAVSEYRTRGYLPEALVNYLVLLGWHPSDDREILSLGDILDSFSLDRIQKGGAIFDEEKLKWYNRQYVSKLSDEDFITHASSFMPEWLRTQTDTVQRLIPLVREKISIFNEIGPMFDAGGELAFVRSISTYDMQLLLWKKNPDPLISKKHLEKIRRDISSISETNFNSTQIKEVLWPYAEANGKGDVLWPFRTAITGQERSPDPFISAAIIGKEEVLQRIDAAIVKLG